MAALRTSVSYTHAPGMSYSFLSGFLLVSLVLRNLRYP